MTTMPTGPKRATMALVLFTLMLAGCNATAGAGRDISAAGNAITNDANSSKEY